LEKRGEGRFVNHRNPSLPPFSKGRDKKGKEGEGGVMIENKYGEAGVVLPVSPQPNFRR
jgi:hypothetical protein